MCKNEQIAASTDFLRLSYSFLYILAFIYKPAVFLNHKLAENK